MSTYTIASGDTLWKIATDHGVTLQALTAANPQVTNPDLIHPGQELNIPQSEAAPPAQNAPAPAPAVSASREMTGGGYAGASVPPAAMPPPPPLASPADAWNSGRPAFKTVAYFTNWGVYGRNYQPQDIPANHITHILYSFANIRPTGEVFLTDTYSDLEKHYPTDSWDESGENVYGCIKQLFLLKKQHRHLKTLLSIGGWTYSANFAGPASTPSGRQTFARSAVHLLADLGFDGIDIDWEYPQDEAQAYNFVLLLQETRAELDRYAAYYLQGKRLLLTIAAPCGPSNYSKLRMHEMDPFLDFWNLMCYDFAGSWDSVAGHQANVFAHPQPGLTPFSADAAVVAYMRGGVHPSKIIFGLPLYGRAFENTSGPGRPFQGVGEGSWENGVWDYKALPAEGAREFTDPQLMASWSFDPAKGTVISYDTPEVTALKTEYIQRRGLGGAMWWELSGDHPVHHERSLIRITGDALGRGGGLDGSENTLMYPGSRYENLRRGFE
ncbi:endochitinase 1 [Aspergillus steynii IBT 23096]|uniref:chitinase n=1 Tax=Aspergillus steynii IBT 23096 TaxID=1392250 RepID=A0A2I2GI91_9EURO|nr:endochitinase 1 [Aspergillus steynii IBT 23096]PLB52596.1 endochitinase 1 [Aspergillus steynii IBT 23096]